MGEFQEYINDLAGELSRYEVQEACCKPDVSVIVPAYNSEKYIYRCLKSLICQTHKNIEILVINDGSTDNTLSIISTFAQYDKRIVVINQENKGVSFARNNGLAAAAGKYIGFVDSDDWVDINFYEKLYNAAEKYNCDIAAANMYRCGNFLKTNRYKYKQYRVYDTPESQTNAAYIPNYSYIWNKIYRRKSLLNCGIKFPVGKIYEDIYWSIRVVYTLNRLVTVPDTFYHYRRTPGSIVTQRNIKAADDNSYAKSGVIQFIRDNKISLSRPYHYRKIKVKFLGLKLLTIDYYYPSIVKVKLFGLLNILRFE